MWLEQSCSSSENEAAKPRCFLVNWSRTAPATSSRFECWVSPEGGRSDAGREAEAEDSSLHGVGGDALGFHGLASLVGGDALLEGGVVGGVLAGFAFGSVAQIGDGAVGEGAFGFAARGDGFEEAGQGWIGVCGFERSELGVE